MRYTTVPDIMYGVSHICFLVGPTAVGRTNHGRCARPVTSVITAIQFMTKKLYLSVFYSTYRQVHTATADGWGACDREATASRAPVGADGETVTRTACGACDARSAVTVLRVGRCGAALDHTD